MAVKIRLKRMGATNRPFYRVVVADSRAKKEGRIIERLGYYNPVEATGQCVLKFDRYEYWLGVGAQPTVSVKALAKRAVAYESIQHKTEPEAAEAVETATDS